MRLNASGAARRLGVSTKTLRLYEEHGLLTPQRTAAGWRTYGPDELARAAEIVALRALGLGLAQVARVLAGELEPALAAHEADLESRLRDLGDTLDKLRDRRADLARGDAVPVVRFALPWPWGGEPFEVHDLRPLSYIVGPLGSGKTRLAIRLAEVLPNAAFLGLGRLADDGAAARARLSTDAELRARVDRASLGLASDGATVSGALTALLAGLEAEGPEILVVDMVEQELDHATQTALIAHLRRRAAGARPLFLMTRSSAILDLAAVGADEAILLCPANHSPPTWVVPRRGAPGYEAVATCLASPDVRARVS